MRKMSVPPKHPGRGTEGKKKCKKGIKKWKKDVDKMWREVIEYGHCLRERRGLLREDRKGTFEAFSDEKNHRKKV